MLRRYLLNLVANLLAQTRPGPKFCTFDRLQILTYRTFNEWSIQSLHFVFSKYA